jgi:periplasmic mercuric ion binding protein
MPRLSILALAVCAAFVGCKPAEEEVLPKITNPPPTSATTDDATATPPTVPPAQSSNADNKIRFVADKKLSVPGMMCPFGCYPTVEKALASVPGVKAVQLAEQPAGTPEGEIALKVVELKLEEGFDISSALAALKSAEFESTELK